MNNRCAKALAICTSPSSLTAPALKIHAKGRGVSFSTPLGTTLVFLLLLLLPDGKLKTREGSCSFYWRVLFPSVSSLFLLVPRLFFLVRISMKNRFDLVMKFEIKIFSRNREVEGKGEREREKGEIDLSIVPLQDSIINFIHLWNIYI